jgi:hypothetical protein
MAYSSIGYRAPAEGTARNRTPCRIRVTPAAKNSSRARPATSSADAGAETRSDSTWVAGRLLSGRSRGSGSGSRSG